MSFLAQQAQRFFVEGAASSLRTGHVVVVVITESCGVDSFNTDIVASLVNPLTIVRHFYDCVLPWSSKVRMIWDDPWIAVATDQGGEPRTFCTTLPPPVPDLPVGLVFKCVRAGDLDLAAWADLVRTRWTPAELLQRLAGAWIPCLKTVDGLVATCVLRPQMDGKWILETLVAQHGYGTLLMRSLMTWIWRHVGGPFVLAYTWELTAAQLVAAWWRGWLASTATFQYGWVWRDGTSCSFCPEKEPWKSVGPRPAMPIEVDGVVVSDSGLGDGWGYVSNYTGTPDWSAVAKKGGWRSLWMRSAEAPSGWRWTGEFVVVGLLNQWGDPGCLTWNTAEITSG